MLQWLLCQGEQTEETSEGEILFSESGWPYYTRHIYFDRHLFPEASLAQMVVRAPPYEKNVSDQLSDPPLKLKVFW